MADSKPGIVNYEAARRGAELPAAVAILGLAGSGKSQAVRLLADRHEYRTVYLGGIVIELVRSAGLAVEPENERRIREQLRVDEGMTAVAQRCLPTIRAALGAGHRVAIDGVYGCSELALIRENVPGQLITIAIHAARTVRIARLAARRERPLSPAEIDERDIREIDALDKARPIVLADHHVVNNEPTIDALGRSLDDILAFAAQQGRP